MASGRASASGGVPASVAAGVLASTGRACAIVPSSLCGRGGVLGAAALCAHALSAQDRHPPPP